LSAQYQRIRATQTTSYRYYAEGYLIEVTDPLAAKSTHTYGLRANLTSSRSQPPPSPTAGAGGPGAIVVPQPVPGATIPFPLAQNAVYTYDLFGNVTMVELDGNRTVYTYNPLNQVTSMTAPMGDALATRDDLSAGHC